MSALLGFQTFQRDFGLHIRAPRHNGRPEGVPERRAKVYRELLFNNVCGVIEVCFPISRKLLGERRWQKLMRAFFAEWRSQTPLFCELSREFLRWMNEAAARDSLPVAVPAYLPELAHYEWAELAVDIMQAEAVPCVPGDLMQERPLVAPAHMLLAYQWPVHRIGPDFKPRKPEATYLAVFRDREDEVRFAAINPVTARLLELLADGDLTGHAACVQVAQEIKHPNPSAVIAGGAAMLNELQEWGVIYGVRHDN